MAIEVSKATAYNGELRSWFRKVKALNPTISTLEGSNAECYNGSLEAECTRLLGIGTTTTTINYVGKVGGSVVENPNKSFVRVASTLQTPSQFVTELSDPDYGKIKSLDGTSYLGTINTNTFMTQQLFSFDMIQSLLQKHSAMFTGATTLTQQIAKLISMTTNINWNWYGFGSSPTGNKANFQVGRSDGVSWGATATHTNGTVTILNRNAADLSAFITNTGFCHSLAFADASNGTVASVINTDYVEMVLTIDIKKL